MAAGLTKAVIREMRWDEARRTNRLRDWARVTIPGEVAAHFYGVNVLCPKCNQPQWGYFDHDKLPEPTPMSIVFMASRSVMVEGWLIVRGHVGECKGCDTVYWG